MPPHAAQGCSQGFEDSAALGTFLSSLPSPSHLPQYLTAFAELRSHRTSKIQQTSRASLLALTMPDGPAQEARDAMWRDRRTDESIVEAWNRTTIDEDASIADPSFMKWVQGYDVVEMVSPMVRFAGSDAVC